MKAMHGNGSAPKFVTFSWGSVKLPKAAPVSISIQYALFHPNGEPMRAFVDLELAQAEDTRRRPGRRRTRPRAAIAGLRSHIVRDGDSLHSIAYERLRRRRRAGGRSPRPTGSTIRCGCGAAATLTIPRLDAMSATATEQHVALYSILVDGERDRRGRWAGAIREVRIQSYLRLPDMCTLAASSPEGQRRARTSRSTSNPFDIGKQLEVQLGAREELTTTTPVQGRDRHARARASAPAASSCWCAASTTRTCCMRSRKRPHVPEPDVERHRLEDRRARPASAPSAIQRRAPRVHAAGQRDRLGLHLAAGRARRLRVRGRGPGRPLPQADRRRARSSSSGRRRCARSARASPRSSRSSR